MDNEHMHQFYKKEQGTSQANRKKPSQLCQQNNQEHICSERLRIKPLFQQFVQAL